MLTPTPKRERELLTQGYTVIAGVDEVGRGALAGPLVAAALVIPTEVLLGRRWQRLLPLVRDSKTLNHGQRQSALKQLVQCGAIWAITEVSVAELNEFGLGNGNRLAVERALAALAQPQPGYALVDYLAKLRLPIPFETVVDGDAHILSIAAASIVAKLHRDALMVQLHGQFPHYSFADHKGYGTSDHLAAINRYGPSPVHRLTFAPVRAAHGRG